MIGVSERGEKGFGCGEKGGRDGSGNESGGARRKVGAGNREDGVNICSYLVEKKGILSSFWSTNSQPTAYRREPNFDFEKVIDRKHS